jgi:Uma2 family endonuclease
MMKGMQSGTLVSVEEYLHTSYSPDCEYLEGKILERNLGEQDHSNMQMTLSAYIFNRRHEWGVHVYPEQRVQVRRDRFRVPDICVVAGERPPEQIFIRPPLLCIEILSPEDRMSEILERVSDYLAFGVRYVWVLDPRTRRAHIYRGDGVHEMKDGMLWTSDPEILVPLDQLFD